MSILLSVPIQKYEMISSTRNNPRKNSFHKFGTMHERFISSFPERMGEMRPSLVLRDKGFFRAEYRDLWMQMIEGHFKSLCKYARSLRPYHRVLPPLTHTHANFFPFYTRTFVYASNSPHQYV